MKYESIPVDEPNPDIQRGGEAEPHELIEGLRPFSIEMMGRALELNNDQTEALGRADDFLLLSWATAAFGDGEFTLHSTSEQYDRVDEPVRELFLGPSVSFPDAYNPLGGLLTSKLNDLRARPGRAAAQVYEGLSKNLALLVALLGVADRFGEGWSQCFPAEPQTCLQIEEDSSAIVTFPAAPDYRYALREPVRAVATMGPGLSAAHFVQDLQGDRPPVVSLVSCSESAIFQHTLAKTILVFQRRFSGAQLKMPEDVLDHCGSVAEYFKAAQKAPIPLDVVVMSSFHYAGQRAAAETISGAYYTLRPGGTLVVKAPLETLCGHEAGLDMVNERAVRLFGDPVDQGACGTLLHHVRDENLPSSRPASFMIFEKRTASQG